MISWYFLGTAFKGCTELACVCWRGVGGQGSQHFETFICFLFLCSYVVCEKQGVTEIMGCFLDSSTEVEGNANKSAGIIVWKGDCVPLFK